MMIAEDVITYDYAAVGRQFAEIVEREERRATIAAERAVRQMHMASVMLSSTRVVESFNEFSRVLTHTGMVIAEFVRKCHIYGDKPTRPLIHKGKKPRR